METLIALFRGINVGGKAVLPMEGLKTLLENLGLHHVKTYIQSGNVVFQSQGQDPWQLSSEIAAEIQKSYGFKPEILLLKVKDLKQVIDANPFPEAETEPKTMHIFFLASIPENPDLKALDNIKKESEQFEFRGNVFYLHAPDGIGRSKLAANVERLLGVPMTGRNWRTVSEIMAIADEYK